MNTTAGGVRTTSTDTPAFLGCASTAADDSFVIATTPFGFAPALSLA